jgi:hypothetical protein
MVMGKHQSKARSVLAGRPARPVAAGSVSKKVWINCSRHRTLAAKKGETKAAGKLRPHPHTAACSGVHFIQSKPLRADITRCGPPRTRRPLGGAPGAGRGTRCTHQKPGGDVRRSAKTRRWKEFRPAADFIEDD